MTGTDVEAQLTLNLFSPANYDFDGFHAGGTVEAVAAVRDWSAGRGPGVVCLWGAAGTGKSHLLQAAIKAAALRAIYVPVREFASAGAEILDDLETLEMVALDDIDSCGGDRRWEQRLFRLYNESQAAGRRLLMASRCSPASKPFELDDLASRIQASLVYQLRELDDRDKAEALRLGARRRGLEIPDSTLDFIMHRERRNMTTLSDLLDVLDVASMSHGRSLTVPFVREVLARRADRPDQGD
jgi:DnaA-homolog protein